MGIGRVAITVVVNNEVKRYTMTDVLCVPLFVNNFFSVTAACIVISMAGYNARLLSYSSEYNDRYKRHSSATARLNTALSYCTILYSPTVSQVSIHRPVPHYIIHYTGE